MDEDILKAAQEAEAACKVAHEAEVVEPKDFWENPFFKIPENGKVPAPSVPAIAYWLRHPDMMLSHVRYNELDDTIETELLPWNPKPHSWTDVDTSHLFGMLQEMTGGLVKSKSNMVDALIIVAYERKYNPLLDMLDTLNEWDGVERAGRVLVDFLGAEDTPYTRRVTLHALYGAVMRAYHPGVKFDECLTLVSKEQGIGKSTLINKLAMKDEYFTDTLGDVSKKEAAENMRGKWIIEIGELESLRKREVETVKLFLSKRADRYREAYGKRSEDRPRRCVFIATTNSTSFLTDKTGNRRFLPVMCNVNEPKFDVFKDLTPEYVGKVWSEIMFKYRKEGTLPLVLPDEIKKAANEHNDVFVVEDPNVGIIHSWTRKHCKPGELVCIVQLMEHALNIQRSDASKNRTLQREISQILDLSDEFTRKKGKPTHSPEYGQQRCWEYTPRDKVE